jgi:hypothetical protein
MGLLKEGDKVRLTEKTAKRFFFPPKTKFTIVDIVDGVPYPIVVNAKKFGADWVEYFKEEELELCQ